MHMKLPWDKRSTLINRWCFLVITLIREGAGGKETHRMEREVIIHEGKINPYLKQLLKLCPHTPWVASNCKQAYIHIYKRSSHTAKSMKEGYWHWWGISSVMKMLNLWLMHFFIISLRMWLWKNFLKSLSYWNIW